MNSQAPKDPEGRTDNRGIFRWYAEPDGRLIFQLWSDSCGGYIDAFVLRPGMARFICPLGGGRDAGNGEYMAALARPSPVLQRLTALEGKVAGRVYDYSKVRETVGQRCVAAFNEWANSDDRIGFADSDSMAAMANIINIAFTSLPGA